MVSETDLPAQDGPGEFGPWEKPQIWESLEILKDH